MKIPGGIYTVKLVHYDNQKPLTFVAVVAKAKTRSWLKKDYRRILLSPATRLII